MRLLEYIDREAEAILRSVICVTVAIDQGEIPFPRTHKEMCFYFLFFGFACVVILAIHGWAEIRNLDFSMIVSDEHRNLDRMSRRYSPCHNWRKEGF